MTQDGDFATVMCQEVKITLNIKICPLICHMLSQEGYATGRAASDVLPERVFFLFFLVFWTPL